MYTGLAMLTFFPLGCGLKAGTILAIARPVVGSSPRLKQDFGLTIGGAFAGQFIAGIGGFIVSKIIVQGDKSGQVIVGLITILSGAAGTVCGTIIGAVSSIALSVWEKNSRKPDSST